MKDVAECHHEDMVLRIYNCPSLVGLEGVVFKSRNCCIRRNGQIIYEPDLVFHNHGWAVVEYKCSDGHRGKAEKQLLIAAKWMWDFWNEKPVLIYAHGEKPYYEVLR